MWCLYVLQSQVKDWYYVGSTNNLLKRVQEHNSGKVRSTKSYKPFKLVYSEDFVSEKDARNREQEVKKKRIAKERIIRHIEGNSGFV